MFRKMCAIGAQKFATSRLCHSFWGIGKTNRKGRKGRKERIKKNEPQRHKGKS